MLDFCAPQIKEFLVKSVYKFKVKNEKGLKMYAIIRDGGRQFKVEVGQELQIDYRDDVNDGDELIFDNILAYRDDEGLKIGQPLLEMKVKAVVREAETKGPKLTVQKFARRKTLRRRTGHRQKYTTVKIAEFVK
ncbi:MAG: 50S ribosomal protein L21 [Planctomycetia bacterium]|nr:50S ribosomal protein L21 [Planctomycetia bacterium]